MSAGLHFEINSRAPCLIESVGRAPTIPGKGPNGIEFAEICLWQASLDYCAERLFIDQLGEPPSETGCKLFEHHDLEAVIALARSIEPEYGAGVRGWLPAMLQQ